MAPKIKIFYCVHNCRLSALKVERYDLPSRPAFQLVNPRILVFLLLCFVEAKLPNGVASAFVLSSAEMLRLFSFSEEICIQAPSCKTHFTPFNFFKFLFVGSFHT